MKNTISFLSWILISVVLIATRVLWFDKNDAPLKVTDWDALGYYIYLPSIFIYEDVCELNWFPKIEKEYKVTGGGQLYQANKHENGNYVYKYLGGVSILQSPFFAVAHFFAKKSSNYKADGFSPPYQYAVALSTVFYGILALFILRFLMLIWFDDSVTALTLILMTLASNFIQYISVDGAMSHGYIFFLCVLVIYSTLKWHRNPHRKWAALTGFIIGLSMICRPTEAVMLFIPLLWDTQNPEAAKTKWNQVKKHKNHIAVAAIFGFLGILPQLIYWHYTTDSFIYNVGSKWDFLSPHWRVLFGWEKGWFVYTPIAIFFILGIWKLKNFPFKKSVIVFCLLNIYIIISWHIWRYGGSYSCRALVQSYPLFALALAAFIQSIRSKKIRYFLYPLWAYLLFVNLFQIWQYNKTIIHYDHNNFAYYRSVYLDANPTPLDMSLLDTDERIYDEDYYEKMTVFQSENSINIDLEGNDSKVLFDSLIQLNPVENWFKVELKIKPESGFWETHLNAKLTQNSEILKNTKIRFFNAISRENRENEYAFFVKIPEGLKEVNLKVFIDSPHTFYGIIRMININQFKK